MNSIVMKTYNKMPKSRHCLAYNDTVATDYICEPYSLLMHYKRAFKFLKGLQEIKGSALLLGHNKHRVTLNWTEAVSKLDIQGGNTSRTRVDKCLLARAPSQYDAIICLDPVLFARHLRHYTLPILGVAAIQDIREYPEILDVIDYLIPATSKRSDVTLRQIIWNSIFSKEEPLRGTT